MDWLVVRHGHTFGPDQQGGEKIILCGSGQNIPLVARGRAKARAFGGYLARHNLLPSAIYANHLLRTWEHACLIRETLHAISPEQAEVPIYLDETLVELDYGAWAGLETPGNTVDTNQVIAKFGQHAWDDWQLRRIMPKGAPHNWQMTESVMLARLQHFADFLANNFQEEDTVVSVGSQGSITYLHSLLPGGMDAAVAEGKLKTAPGNFAHLRFVNGAWELVAWDQHP